MAKTLSHIDTRFLGVVILVFSVLAGVGLWRQNDAIADTQECMITAFTDRDESNKKTRDAAIDWLDEFIAFLRDIEVQQSAKPLIDSAVKFRNRWENAGVVVSVTQLEECK